MDTRRLDLAWLAGLFLASASLSWGVRAVLGFGGPAGTDPALWTRSVLDLEQGLTPAVSPLYPALVAVVHGGMDHAVDDAVLVTAAATALVGPLVYLLGRALGARPVLAGLAALAALLSPAVGGFSARVGPDALAASTFAATALAAVAFARLPTSRLRLLALLALVALAPLVREHGLIIAACVTAVVALAPGSWSERGIRLGVLVLAVLLAPLLVGEIPAMPWELEWNGRLFHPLRDMAGAVPKYAGVLRPAPYERLVALYAAGDRVGIAFFHLWWALHQDPGTWLAVLLALASLLRLDRHRWAVAVGLVPVLPALVIWSAPRHVGVALPVAAAVLAAAWGREQGARRWGAMVAVLLLVGVVMGRWSRHGRVLAQEAEGIEALRRTGEALCAVAKPGDLGVGELEAFLFCPLPVHGPTNDGSAADWRTWWVTLAPGSYRDTGSFEGEALHAVQPPPLPWARVWLDVPDRFQVYRLAPWVGHRPCGDSVPRGAVTFLPQQPRAVTMHPPCAVDPWSFGAPPARALEAPPTPSAPDRRSP